MGAVAVSGCQPVQKAEGQRMGSVAPYSTTYRAIVGGTELSRPVSLCELLKYYNAGAGLYRVTSLVGRAEPSAADPSVTDAFTYANLELVEDWSGGAPQKPVARIVGGPLDAQRTRSWRVSLAVGEVVGVLLEAPSSENAGYYGLHSLTVYKQQDAGGHSNGQLFRHGRAGELGAKLRRLSHLSGKACEAEDVLPENDEVAPGPAPKAGKQPVTVHTLEGDSNDP
jgi:hypothetical protein